MRLNNSEDTASKLVVSILDMESFFGFILSDSMIFNSFFNYTFICKKLVSELRRFGTTAQMDSRKDFWMAGMLSKVEERLRRIDIVKSSITMLLMIKKRTFGWLECYRRLRKDYEGLT